MPLARTPAAAHVVGPEVFNAMPRNIAVDEAVKGYTLLHARVAYRLPAGWNGLEATASVRNLLGKQYIAFSEPDPDGNSFQPAAEREVFVGLRVTP